MIRIILLLVVFCRFSSPLPHRLNEKNDANSFKFLSPNSFQTYKTRTWLENDIMQISFQFQTRDINGQLAAVTLAYSNGETSNSNENTNLIFDLFLKNSLIHARFGLENEHRRKHLVYAADASDGKSHTANLTIYPTERKINLAIDDEIQTYSYRYLDLSSNVGETKLVFGYSGRETGHVDVGFVGCISNVMPKLGDKNFHVEMSEQIENDCSDACNNRCPSETDCVNFYSDYKCDCYRSKKEGDDCAEDSSIVNLDGQNAMLYNLDSTNNFRIRRIGLAFKTFIDSEQVLFDGHLNRMTGNHGRLTAHLTKSQKIAVTLGDEEHLYEIGTDNFADGTWHFVTIEINIKTKSIDLQVDDFGWMSIGLKSIDMKFHDKNPLVSFGGLLDEDVEGSNFQGCMKELYINYDSVLFHIKRRQPNDSEINRRISFGCGPSQILHPYQRVIYANQEQPLDTLSIDEGSAIVDQENAVVGGIENVVDKQPDVDKSPEYEDTSESQTSKINQMYPDDNTNLVPDESKPIEEVLKAGAGESMTDAHSEVPEQPTGSTQPSEIVVTEAESKSDGGNWGDVFGNYNAETKSTPEPEAGHTDHHVNAINFNVHQDSGHSPSPKPRKTCDSLDCGNNGHCMDDGTEDAKCDCREGFIGKTCLFSNLPRSCDELFNMGERRSGVYRIDPVGSEDDSYAYVNCQMEETTSRGITIVDHNFPNSTQVRGKNMTDTTFIVSYKFMTENALKNLVDGSLSCKQHIRYDCNQAPLQFMMSSTFFESAHKKQEPFARIGTSKGKCPCAAISPSTCTGASTQSPNNTCNCDSSDANPLFDEGDMVNDFAAITKLTFLQYTGKENRATMSLGSLVCEGSKGYDDVVQFKTNYAHLTLPPWKGKSFSFWFRTSNGDNNLVSQNSPDSTRFLKVSTLQAHILDVKFNFGGIDRRVEVPLQKPVNDSHWHKVLIEHVKNRLRFSLDTQNSFYKLQDDEHLDDKTFTENFYIGANPLHSDFTGFVGCIRQFIEDEAIIDIDQLLIDQNVSLLNIVPNCQDKCKTDKPCKNNAECVEDYENNSFKCQCFNPRIHLGDDCGTDINQNSDVSFHNPTNSFVNLTNLPNNPVTNDIVFSFKTDQPDALLMYAHDQDYNFIQVHLSSGNKISMTANFEKNLRQCTITRPDKEFDTMEWIQIIIDYETDYLALYADKLFCRIEGRRTLSDFYVETWENPDDVQDVVVPPRSPFKPKDPTSVDQNTILFVGGIPNLGVIGGRNKRQSFYQTYLPNLLGAVRGLRVGENTVNLQHEGVKPNGTVKQGSNFGCESLHCKNGGVCNVAWMTPNEKASCDCSMTSFAGGDCADDNGVHFDGKTYVSFDMKDYLETVFVGTDRSYDNLRFTFSSGDTLNDTSNQLLVDLIFNNKNELKLTLNKQKGHLHLAVTDIAMGGTKGLDIGGSYADGTRHFVYIKFSTGKILIRVDQQNSEMKSSLNLDKLVSVTLGGAPESNLPTKNHNYTGCMSNAIIEFTTARVISVTPLVYATDANSKLKLFTTVEPSDANLQTTTCADYKVVKPAETVAAIVVMPDWNQPLIRQPYVRIVGPVDPSAEGGNYGVAIGLIILLIILLLVVGIFLYYKKCRKPKQPENPPPTENPTGKVVPNFPPGQGELDPLIHGEPGKPGPLNTGRHSHMGKIDPDQGELPEADEDLDKFAPLNDAVYNNGYDPHQQHVHFPPPPTAEDIKAMSPTVPHKPQPPYKGTFTYGGLPYVDESRKSSENADGKVPVIIRRGSSKRTQPKEVPIPKI